MLYNPHHAGFASTQNASYGVMETFTKISKEGLGGKAMYRVGFPASNP
jgi:hypothetical protein